MGNEWWKSDLDGEQDADAPKSLRIPKTTNYTLEGGVNELPNSGTNDVWGRASLSQSPVFQTIAWFFFGMSLVPFLLFSISLFTPQPITDTMTMSLQGTTT